MDKKSRKNRPEIHKVYGRDTVWAVFKHNLLKLLAVDILSKSFIALAGSLLFTGAFLGHQILVTETKPSWAELAVAIAPPTFLALYWIERHAMAGVLEALADWIRNRK